MFMCRVSRRPPDGSLKHYIGQVVTCGADNDKAVIYRKALTFARPYL